MSKKNDTLTHYIYMIEHLSGKYYFGRRSYRGNPFRDKYMGSGVWVRRIKDKSALIKTIVKICDTFEELVILEQYYIDFNFGLEGCMNYLQSSCGAGVGVKNPFYGKKHSDDMKIKMSIMKTGSNHPNFGTKYSQETKLKMSISAIGKIITKKTRANMSIASRGRDSDLTEDIVREIKTRLTKSNNKNSYIAELYGVTPKIIYDIKVERTWKWVKI